MVEFIKITILGMIQGVTEWLPISSTGHMLLFNQFFPLSQRQEFVNVFTVMVQLGSVLAVLVLYPQRLWPFKKDNEQSKQCLRLWLKVLIATIPAAVAGFLLDDMIEEKLSTWQVISASLFFYGVLYVLLERKLKLQTRIPSLETLSKADSLKIGIFQMLALIPGTSRSGSTILGGIVIGVDRPVVAEFSFFMAVPVMLGASLLRLVKAGFDFTSTEWLLMLWGSLVAFIVSLLVIRALVSYVRRHDFSAFGIYRIVLAIAVAGFFTFGR